MEAGFAQLGGTGIFLDTSKMQIAHGESAKDTAKILSSYGHGIACRNCFWEVGNKYLREMAENASVQIGRASCSSDHEPAM
jgi:ornithine carbamoyltransferase